MLFTELLTKHGIERTGVSHGIQQKMKKYDKFASAVEVAKKEHETSANPNKKKSIEDEITLGQENMAALNDEICVAIEKYVGNKELNQRRAEILKNARDKKVNKGTVKDFGLTVPMIAKKISEGEKLSEPEHLQFYENNKEAIEAELLNIKEAAEKPIEHTPVKTAKKDNAGKIVIGVLAAIAVGVGAVIGIRAWNKNN